jgi:hypothetical protein
MNRGKRNARSATSGDGARNVKNIEIGAIAVAREIETPNVTETGTVTATAIVVTAHQVIDPTVDYLHTIATHEGTHPRRQRNRHQHLPLHLHPLWMRNH